MYRKHVETVAGMRYGNLVAVKRQENTYRNERYWECLCDCGRTVVSREFFLATGLKKHCGCKGIIIGKKYHHLEVIGPIPAPNKAGGRWWNCRCDCGKEVGVTGHKLRNETIRTCGKCEYDEKDRLQRKTGRKLKDLTGMKFGMLTVTERADASEKYKHRWKCKCECGLTKIFPGSVLYSGARTNCGCVVGRRPHSRNCDWTGHRFGRLTAVSRAGLNKYRHMSWNCMCDCGNKTVADAHMLVNGSKKSCGCWRYRNDEHVIGSVYGDLTVVAATEIRKTKKRERKWKMKCSCGKMVLRTLSQVKSGCKHCGDKVHFNYKTDHETLLTYYYNHCKNRFRSGKRVKNFDLDYAFLAEALFKPCFYCGGDVSNKYKSYRKTGGTLLYNGLDRIDSHLGYTKDNVVTCCRRCNIMKMQYSKDEFIAHIKRLYEHLQLKK